MAAETTDPLADVRAALAFYGAESSYQHGEDESLTEATAIQADGGLRAQVALAALDALPASSSPEPTGGEAPDAREAVWVWRDEFTGLQVSEREPLLHGRTAARYVRASAPAPTGGREARGWTLGSWSGVLTLICGPRLNDGEQVVAREVLSETDAPEGSG